MLKLVGDEPACRAQLALRTVELHTTSAASPARPHPRGVAQVEAVVGHRRRRPAGRAGRGKPGQLEAVRDSGLAVGETVILMAPPLYLY